MTYARRPLIGLTIGPEHEGGVDLHLRSTYVRAIDAAGGAPVLLPASGAAALEAVLERLDGIVFPGGADLEPSLYSASPHPKTRVNRDLDRLELPVAHWAINSDVPVLGICRGQQLLNVAAGGTLIQHLETHQRQSRFTRSLHSHPLRIQPESRLAEILGETETSVNSLHHQAVDAVGDGLLAVGWAPDGTIEALEGSRHPWLVTVQFHPEDLLESHVPSQRLFAAFIAACRERAGKAS